MIGACRCDRSVNQCSEPLQDFVGNTGSERRDTDRTGTMGRTGTGGELLRTGSASTLELRKVNSKSVFGNIANRRTRPFVRWKVEESSPL